MTKLNDRKKNNENNSNSKESASNNLRGKTADGK